MLLNKDGTNSTNGHEDRGNIQSYLDDHINHHDLLSLVARVKNVFINMPWTQTTSRQLPFQDNILSYLTLK